jgi:AmmeMemoRadiSam system protein B
MSIQSNDLQLHDVRPSPLAGRWYPADRARLAALVDGFLDAATPEVPPGAIVGLLVPHAGLIYSGPVAAYAFKLVMDLAPEIVAVIGPSHHVATAPLLTSGHDAYRTPLGNVPVAREAIAALGQHVELHPVRNDPEHALEIELPFLQRVLPHPFKLLPVMMADQSAATASQLGAALAEVLAGRKALLVASSDLSHFYPDDHAHRLDREMLAEVDAFSPQGVLAAEDEQRGFACGRGAIAAVMCSAQALGADHARILHYDTSATTSHDAARVVGYGAGVFFQAASN